MVVKRRKKQIQPSDELPEEMLMGDIEPDWGVDDYDRGDFADLEGETDPTPAPRKQRKKRAPSKKKDHVPLSAPPFQILLFNPSERKYKWVDKWDGRKAPGPSDLRDKYGPGRYEVRDELKNSERWDIGPSPFDAPAQAEPETPPPEIEADHESPPPPRIYSHEPPPWMHPPPPYGNPPAWGATSSTAPGAGAPSPWPTPPPAPIAPAPVASSTPDAQTLGTIYRLDAAIQQIAADQRRIQDELRSVTYELQQVPGRVAERVSSTIEQASDPFDQMSKVWDMSRMIADGHGPGEKEEPSGLAGLAEGLIAALAAKMGQGVPPAEAGAPPQLEPPPPPHHPNGGRPAFEAGAELPGMTPQIRQELMAHASARGLQYEDAITMARRHGWTAAELLHLARNPPPTESVGAPGSPAPTWPDGSSAVPPPAPPEAPKP